GSEGEPGASAGAGRGPGRAARVNRGRSGAASGQCPSAGNVASGDGSQAEDERQRDVGQGQAESTVGHQRPGLQGEGGDGGVAAEEAGGDQQPEIGGGRKTMAI